MTIRTGLPVLVAAACIWPVQGQDQTKTPNQKPSAKEMFLNPRQMAYGAQDEAPPSAATKPKPGVKPGLKPKPKPKPAEVAATDRAPSAQAEQGAVSVIPASYSAVPLGLRYTVRKRDGDQTTDVSPDTEFHSGDHIQLTLEVNDAGFLYIIQQGTSGKWEALFPSPEIENGDNRVQRGHVYTVPPGHVFTFSGAAGVERLFVIFSRQPVQEIDGLIYSLKGGRRAPASQPGRERPAAETLLASAAPIDDTRIVNLRETYSRDLIIEKGDQEPDGQQPDKAVYVVNPKGSADSRVVADIPLIHK